MELYEASAAALHRALRAREVSPLEILESVLRQHDRINAMVTAVIALDADGATQAARQSELRMQRGELLGGLDGIPVSIKDNLLVRGLPATWGSAKFENYRPLKDEIPIARLKSRGAIIIGKTNVPEFTLQGYTCNRLFGGTRNPWAIDFTPGGSSGGAAAAVACGIGPIALGTDGGGSTRRPAGYTNLIGFKPSIGKIPRGGGFPEILYDLEVVGLIARTVEDVLLLYHDLVGPHPQDRKSFIHGLQVRPQVRKPRPKRIRLHMSFNGSPVDTEIIDSVKEAAIRLEEIKCRVDESQPSFSPEEMAGLLSVIFATGLAKLVETKVVVREDVGESLWPLLSEGRQVSGAKYLDVLDRTWELRNQAAEVFGRYDFIMTPTSAAMPWRFDAPYPTRIDGREVGPRGHAVFTGFVNLLGLPAISLPARPSSKGLPIGFQLVGPFGSDQALLDLACAYETSFPSAQKWPPLV